MPGKTLKKLKSTNSSFASPRLSSAVRLTLCAAGICCCYLYYGMLQEQIFFNKGNVHVDATFLLLSQTVSNTAVAVVWQKVSGAIQTDRGGTPKSTGITEKHGGHLHHALLTLTAFCYFVAMTASNECLHYVSYPTAVLAKSCKLIPTMIMGYLVERRSYHPREWIGAACITCGIVLFNISRLNQKDTGGENDVDSAYGLALLILSLVMDGLLGACQGLLKREDEQSRMEGTPRYRAPTATETMLYVNLYATAFQFPLAVVTGQWSNGMNMLRQEGWDGLGRGMLLLNGCAAAGQIFIFLTITLYSPLICTTITTTRKFFTILISVIHFGHKFSADQWCCVFLVFGGLYLGIASKASATRQGKEEDDEKIA